MNQNRYRPPKAPLDPRRREPGSIPKAVTIGAIIDIGGTILTSSVISFLYAVMLGVQGRSSAEIERSLTQIDPWSLLGFLFLAAGLVMSVLGGYQCAVIANRNSHLAPGILSVVSVGLGAAASGKTAQLPELLFFSALTVAAILGGAWIHTRKLAEHSPGRADK